MCVISVSWLLAHFPFLSALMRGMHNAVESSSAIEQVFRGYSRPGAPSVDDLNRPS